MTDRRNKGAFEGIFGPSWSHNSVRHIPCFQAGILSSPNTPPTIMFASRSFSRSLVAVCALALVLAACDSTTPSTITDTPPALISSSAFDMDGESFGSTSAQPGQSTSSVSGPHHTRAYLTVVLVNLAVGVHLIVPSTATVSAGQDTPHVENGTWIWENTMTIFINNVVDVRLEGTPNGSVVDWEMFITSDNLLGQTYDNFILYTATTQIGGGMSTWSLYYDLAGLGRTRVLDADYLQTGAQHELTFSIPESNPNEDARGDSVYYMADGNDRVFDHEVGPGENRLIEWDSATKAGSIMAFDYLDGERYCWNDNLDNTPCVPTL